MSIRRTVTVTLAVGLAAGTALMANATPAPTLKVEPSLPHSASTELPPPSAQLPPVLPFCDALCRRDTDQPDVAQTCLLHRYGSDGVPADYKAMRTSCGSAAAAGDAHAQTLLGELSFLGLGQEQNFAAAARWYGLAAAQGHPHAQLMMYEMTRLKLLPATTAATEWLVKAAAAGHPQARALQQRI